ncbi:acyltransferase [Paenibacillus sp. HWE-109]|uniref:acyltransferase n=1 Tax=Paenibacillus sp. HWE-109 TaxID=1306526 RepID=UPI001EE0BE68|nr:acyltransferase [Paenibacillus sp. HWE-109]UKS24916.1 acyltransferase [Paenibacillus sp. HWE-109]
MATEPINKSRFPELDFIRAIAVIAVIVIHVTSITLTKTDPDQFTRLSSVLINQLSRFCVPAFLFVSGILAYHSFQRRSTYSGLIVSKLKALIVPYIVWTTIGLLFFLSFSINYKGIIMIFLTGSGPFYQLYYIPLLFQLFVILPLIMRIELNKQMVVLIFLMTCFLLAGYQVLLLSESSHASGVIGYLNTLLQSAFFSWFIYFYLGLFAAKYYANFLEFVKSKSFVFFVTLYVICTILLIADAYYSTIIHKQSDLMGYFRVTVLFYSLATILVLIKLGMIIQSRLLENIYRNSFGIYLIHVAVLKLIYLVSSHMFANPAAIVASIVLTMLISYGMIEVIQRSPLSWLLLGQKSINARRRTNIESTDHKLVR